MTCNGKRQSFSFNVNNETEGLFLPPLINIVLNIQTRTMKREKRKKKDIQIGQMQQLKTKQNCKDYPLSAASGSAGAGTIDTLPAH